MNKGSCNMHKTNVRLFIDFWENVYNLFIGNLRKIFYLFTVCSQIRARSPKGGTPTFTKCLQIKVDLFTIIQLKKDRFLCLFFNKNKQKIFFQMLLPFYDFLHLLTNLLPILLLLFHRVT